MRILVDALGNPAQSGGMNLYARELVLAWMEEFPDDELVVVGGEWARSAFEQTTVTVHVVSQNSALRRFWGQAIWNGVLMRRYRCDRLLSLSSMGAFTVPRKRVGVVVHDWRHRRRPEEFGRAQLLYRRLWIRSVRRAGVAIAISAKTRDETAEFTSRNDSLVVENGSDHPRRWPVYAKTRGEVPLVLTYGHFVNKRPEAVIEAVASLVDAGDFDGGQLVVLGARGAYGEALAALAERLGVRGQIAFPGFVSDAEYQELVQSSSIVVLNSSDEGYGLPVSEAAFFGIPAIGASDSGLAEIHGPRVIISDPTPEALTATLREQLSDRSAPTPNPRRWADTAADIRRALVGVPQ